MVNVSTFSDPFSSLDELCVLGMKQYLVKLSDVVNSAAKAVKVVWASPRTLRHAPGVASASAQKQRVLLALHPSSLLLALAF
jgi:hypothetical protein